MTSDSKSHYVPFFTETHVRLHRAVCGTTILMRDHSPEPSCPQCLAWLDADEKDAAALAAKWDAEGKDAL